MFVRYLLIISWLFAVVALGAAAPGRVSRAPAAPATTPRADHALNPAQAGPALDWHSPARWVRGLKRTSGTLVFTGSGVEFRTQEAQSLKWTFEEVQTFYLSSRRFRLTSYRNRKWHRYGDRSFKFELAAPVPPEVAAQLASKVGKPVENGDPDPSAAAFATLPARHRTRSGGTNGMLRFRESGIDYVTESGRGARSWRWSDIETLANSDPYHFRLGAYRETFEFELKSPMSAGLFDGLWNFVYARDLSGLNVEGGVRP
jgi:hypothetical protein